MKPVLFTWIAVSSSIVMTTPRHESYRSGLWGLNLDRSQIARLQDGAIANCRYEGVTQLLFDDSPEVHTNGGHGKILGGAMIALAIEMGADAVDIGKTIHPPPTLGESIGMAMEVAHGSCNDLPPAKNAAAMLCIGTKFISTPSKPMRYNARHCERTLLYQTLAEHYETWLVFACAVQFDGQVDHYSP
eukprot:gene23304-28292_t